MRRSGWILAGIAAASALLAAGSFLAARQLSAARAAAGVDDLEWLRLEFRLSEGDLARIRRLHDGYLPKCRHYCAEIAARRHVLAVELSGAPHVTPRTDQLLAEIADLRATCQSEMLRHFNEVSGAMPPEQGRRYLAEMRRATLGHHDAVEAGMAGGACGAHGQD